MMGPSITPRLTLDTKTDILNADLNIVIHQPSIDEISLIGENIFVIGINSLTKDYTTEIRNEDNSNSSQLSNFDIFMSIINEKLNNSKIIKNAVYSVLFLILPAYNINFTPRSIILQDLQGEEKKIHMIDASNFDILANIIYHMFCMQEFNAQIQNYNPQGDRARALVEKFKKKREYLENMRRQRGEDSSTQSLYGRYIDILAVGLQKDKNILKKYSVFQLIEEFKRFQLKEEFDYTFQAKMAGATKVKDAKNWMDDIQFGNNNSED